MERTRSFTRSESDQTLGGEAPAGVSKPTRATRDRVVLHNLIYTGCFRGSAEPGCFGKEAISIRRDKVSSQSCSSHSILVVVHSLS